MSEMIERVKTAIAEKIAPAIDARAPYAKVMIDLAARAALEAMREPTEEMKAYQSYQTDEHGDPDFVHQWQRMIDVALAS